MSSFLCAISTIVRCDESCLRNQHRVKVNLSTSANGGTVIGSSAMVTAIRILRPDGLMDRARLLGVCPVCGGTLYLADVDRARKVETWECAQTECAHTEDAPSPSSR